jgi:photosystem II stability/assembly factor-like uncharacterized protein
MTFIKIIAFSLLSTSLFAQLQTSPNPVAASSGADRLKAMDKRKTLTTNSLLNGITYRNVGPTVQSGRVVDVDVNPKDPSVFYTAYASGGLWKTESNGAEMMPLFDNQAVMTIGDVAVNWDKKIIWLGTGENNSSRSSYAGAGVYKSTDDGKTWQHTGLEETQHIGRIVLHPTNPDIVWVAALGHLYSPNKERGVYMTKDGGKTWTQTLYVDDTSGAIDIVVDENDPSVLYAAMWTKERRAWNFEESGKGSGIYKSTDGGMTWQSVTASGAGFPTGTDVGRIGLALAKKGNNTLIFAVIDNQGSKPAKTGELVNDDIQKEDIKKMSKETFLALKKSKITTFLRNNSFPEKYKADDIIEQIKSNKITIQTLYDFVDSGDDGFSNRFGVIGAEVYCSEDGGKSWKKTHNNPIPDQFFTYGYYFAQIRVNPANPDKVYVLGLNAIGSNDGGKTWRNLDKDNVHSDHHALWINPNRAGHLINGNDGGINITYDDGKTWFKCNNPPVGQFYHINVDMNEPYNVYGGLQDNGVWFGSSKSEPNVDWMDSGHNEYRRIMGGDGMQTMIDTRDNTTVYTGFQFGVYARTSTKQGTRPRFITPKHDLGEKPLRFNWQTPILLSQHNQDVLYFGANKLYRSLDKGDSWERISDDLTKGGKKGNVPYGTLTAVHESSFKFGLLYVGSDDGLIHLTRDGGNTWKNITVEERNTDKLGKGLPSDLWVSRIQASSHDKATVYVSLNGYRWDDFNSYLYVSTNYGDTWTRIGTDLPAEPVNVVKEDPQNPNIIYVGTDHNLYVSLDKGKSFQTMSNGLPHVAIHDLVIHPRDKELVVGTHGRSLFIADVQHVQQLDDKTLAKDFVVFDLKKQTNRGWGIQRNKWVDMKPVTMTIPNYAKSSGQATVTIRAGKDLILSKSTVSVQKGLNYSEIEMTFDEKQNPPREVGMLAQYSTFLNMDKKDKDTKDIELKRGDDGKFYLQKGKYLVEVEKDGVKVEKELVIE